jgi:hypothetical protein
MHLDPHELKKTTLAHTTEDKAFVVCRGDHINNITDLANCIESLNPDQFKHHVSIEGRNHFADWIKEVLKNPLLAHDLNYPINLNNQQHYVMTIRHHVQWLESV